MAYSITFNRFFTLHNYIGYFGFPDSFEAFQSKPSEARKWRQTVVGVTKLKDNFPGIKQTSFETYIKHMERVLLKMMVLLQFKTTNYKKIYAKFYL